LGPRRLAAFIKGVPLPQPEVGPATLASLRAAIDEALSTLRSLNQEEFKGAEDRVIGLPFMAGKGMKASDLVIQFALPNFYFHAVTTYAILRHNGVDVGKMDFLGALDLRDL